MHRLFAILSLAFVAGCQALTKGASDGAAAVVAGAPPPAGGGGFLGWDALVYTAAAGLAYTVGSAGKGWIRSMRDKRGGV